MLSPSARRLELWTNIILVAITSFSIALIWMLFLSLTLGEKDKAASAQADRLVRAGRVLASGMDGILENSRSTLSLLAGQVAYHEKLDPAFSPEFLSLVRVSQSPQRAPLPLRAVDHSGAVFYFDSVAAKARGSVVDRSTFQSHLAAPVGTFFVDQPVLNPASGKWHFDLSLTLPQNGGNLAYLIQALDFEALDHLVQDLAEAEGESVALFRGDGKLLYQHPLQPGFPYQPEQLGMFAIGGLGSAKIVRDGDFLRTYQKLGAAPVWVVASRPAESLTLEWKRGFEGQMVWVGILTLVLILTAAGLHLMLIRLRRYRMAQEELARVDSLTGLLNRRAFLERCDTERIRAARIPSALTLVLLDLDRFKQVNDEFGHPAGDKALKDFTAVLVKNLRASDALARLGGDEFAVLMPGTDAPGALETVERLRVATRAIVLPSGHFSASIGLAAWDGKETFEAWYHRADRALYRAKEGGRDRVECEPLPSQTA